MLLFLLGNKISTQTAIGTSIAIAGVAVYSYIKAQMEEAKKVKLLAISCLLLHCFMSWLRWTEVDCMYLQKAPPPLPEDAKTA